VSPDQLRMLREGIYRFTGLGFSYPTAELIDTAAATVPILDDLGLFDYAFALPVAEAAEALSAADLSELERAYSALFAAGVSGPACSPHLTTYVANARTGEVARVQAELRSTYRRFGIGDAISDGDLVDHIATELEAMARLCGDASAASRQHEFFTTYLEPWVPQFSSCVREIDRHPCYTALATSLYAFVEHERDMVPLLLSSVGCDS
jgi:TorA maturation chaperone TorD